MAQAVRKPGGAAASGTPVGLVSDADKAAELLHPLRRRLIEDLSSPASASGLARRLGVARQKVNYHLRELERAGLVELVEERRKGNCTERIVRAAARAYLVDPQLIGGLAREGATPQDRASSAYFVHAAANAVRDVAIIRERAAAEGKPVATFTLEADVRFASTAARHAFAEELANEVARLVAKHHDEGARGGRVFRLLVGVRPAITRAMGGSGRDRQEAS
jgi:DNA-binding transcriptional ArsR family regulator